jgi:hypothetical protein
MCKRWRDGQVQISFLESGKLENRISFQSNWRFFVEVSRAWDQARRSGSGFLLHKTQSPIFFIYVVKPDPK